MNRIVKAHAKLLVHDGMGRYESATAEVIPKVARQVIDPKLQQGAQFTTPSATMQYLKLAGSSVHLHPKFIGF